jgi:hypothetical protein
VAADGANATAFGYAAPASTYVGNSDQVRGAIYLPGDLTINNAGDVVTATPGGAIDIPEVTIVGQPVAWPAPAAQPFQLAPLLPTRRRR